MSKKSVVTVLLAVIIVLGVITYMDAEGIIKLPVKLPWSDLAKQFISKTGESETTTTTTRSTTPTTTTTATPTTTSAPKITTTTVAEAQSNATTTRMPGKLVGVNMTQLESIVKPETVSAKEKARENILGYYNAVKKEDLNITRFFDLSVVDEDSLINLHKAFYEAYDIKKLEVSNFTCTFVSNDTIKCTYTVTITVVDENGEEMTQVNNLVTFTNSEGLIIQTVPAE